MLQASFSDSVVVKCGSTTLLRFVLHSELLPNLKVFKGGIIFQSYQEILYDLKTALFETWIKYILENKAPTWSFIKVRKQKKVFPLVVSFNFPFVLSSHTKVLFNECCVYILSLYACTCYPL